MTDNIRKLLDAIEQEAIVIDKIARAKPPRDLEYILDSVRYILDAIHKIHSQLQETT